MSQRKPSRRRRRKPPIKPPLPPSEVDKIKADPSDYGFDNALPRQVIVPRDGEDEHGVHPDDFNFEEGEEVVVPRTREGPSPSTTQRVKPSYKPGVYDFRFYEVSFTTLQPEFPPGTKAYRFFVRRSDAEEFVAMLNKIDHVQSLCPRCSELLEPYTVCPNCGGEIMVRKDRFHNPQIKWVRLQGSLQNILIKALSHQPSLPSDLENYS